MTFAGNSSVKEVVSRNNGMATMASRCRKTCETL